MTTHVKYIRRRRRSPSLAFLYHPDSFHFCNLVCLVVLFLSTQSHSLMTSSITPTLCVDDYNRCSRNTARRRVSVESIRTERNGHSTSSPILQFQNRYRYQLGTRLMNKYYDGNSFSESVSTKSNEKLKDNGSIAPCNSNNTNSSNVQSDIWLQWMSTGLATPQYNSGSTIASASTDSGKIGKASSSVPLEYSNLRRSYRCSSKDWWHNTINLPNSAILRSILFPVVSMTIWSLVISLIYRFLIHHRKAELAARMCIPSAPHGLTVSALGLLLVFRTNSAYQRFSEARTIWEQILSTSRDLSRLCKLYEREIGVPKVRRVQRLLAAFPYLLRFRIRPNSIMKKIDDPDFVRDPEFSLILYQDHAGSDTDEEAAAVASDEEISGVARRKPRELYWVDKRTLPWRLLPGSAMEECARAQNRPLWVCDRMAKELHSVPDGPNFTGRERLTLVAKVESLSRAIGACERIHQTVVPLNYARHSLRSLTVWLLSLPFSLVKDLDLITAPVVFIISWMLFGVYEIGYTIEDPFQASLRFPIICDAIRRDVLGDEIIRNTAYRVDDSVSPDIKRDTDPGIDDDDENEEVSDVEIREIFVDPIGNFIENFPILESAMEYVSSSSLTSPMLNNFTLNGSSSKDKLQHRP